MTFMRILEVRHGDWRQTDIPNTFHTQGEEFVVKSLFCGLAVPTTYYVGLDNRETVNRGDTLAAITGEPTGNGYLRCAVSTFTATQSVKWVALSARLTFSGSGGSWGPIRTAFLATSAGTGGFLISTVTLQEARTVQDGQTLSFKFALGPGI